MTDLHELAMNVITTMINNEDDNILVVNNFTKLLTYLNENKTNPPNDPELQGSMYAVHLFKQRYYNYKKLFHEMEVDISFLDVEPYSKYSSFNDFIQNENEWKSWLYKNLSEASETFVAQLKEKLSAFKHTWTQWKTLVHYNEKYGYKLDRVYNGNLKSKFDDLVTLIEKTSPIVLITIPYAAAINVVECMYEIYVFFYFPVYRTAGTRTETSSYYTSNGGYAYSKTYDYTYDESYFPECCKTFKAENGSEYTYRSRINEVCSSMGIVDVVTNFDTLLGRKRPSFIPRREQDPIENIVLPVTNECANWYSWIYDSKSMYTENFVALVRDAIQDLHAKWYRWNMFNDYIKGTDLKVRSDVSDAVHTSLKKLMDLLLSADNAVVSCIESEPIRCAIHVVDLVSKDKDSEMKRFILAHFKYINYRFDMKCIEWLYDTPNERDLNQLKNTLTTFVDNVRSLWVKCYEHLYDPTIPNYVKDANNANFQYCLNYLMNRLEEASWQLLIHLDRQFVDDIIKVMRDPIKFCLVDNIKSKFVHDIPLLEHPNYHKRYLKIVEIPNFIPYDYKNCIMMFSLNKAF